MLRNGFYIKIVWPKQPLLFALKNFIATNVQISNKMFDIVEVETVLEVLLGAKHQVSVPQFTTQI